MNQLDPAFLLSTLIAHGYHSHATIADLSQMDMLCHTLLARAFPACATSPIIRPFDNGLPSFESDAGTYLSLGAKAMGYTSRFFRRVAVPMAVAAEIFGQDPTSVGRKAALEALKNVEPCDWRTAMEQWIIYHMETTRA